MVFLQLLFAAALLQLNTPVAAHGYGSDADMPMAMGHGSNLTHHAPVDPNDVWYLPSYSGLEAHSGTMLAHIGFMTAAWFFLLPIGGWSSQTPPLKL
jgi:hypothetical protein